MVLSLFRRLVAAHPDRRLEPRGTRIDGRIVLDGRHYGLKDWSRRGFSAVGVGAEHYPGDKITLSVEVELDEETLRFDCRAVVVWVDRERRELAAVFTELDGRIQEKIMRVLFARSAEAQGVSAPMHA
jgi:hypothetical protein